MGQYDVPALLDYIEEETGQKQVAYVGHSQGCAQMFSALVDQSDYFKDRLSIFIALAPAVELGHTYSPLLEFLEANGKDLNTVVQDIGAQEMMKADGVISETMKELCDGDYGFYCQLINEYIADANLLVDDAERFKVYMAHYPAGTSFRSINHFG